MEAVPAVRSNRFVFIHLFFFFQAEDGIRDFHVTGVQTCALPISADHSSRSRRRARTSRASMRRASTMIESATRSVRTIPSRRRRSEERRVGKECRSRWSAEDSKKNKKTQERTRGVCVAI